MIASWSSTVRVIRMRKSATAAIGISSASAMPKIFKPIETRIGTPPRGRGQNRPPTRYAEASRRTESCWPERFSVASRARLQKIGRSRPAEASPPITFSCRSLQPNLGLRLAVDDALRLAYKTPRHGGQILVKVPLAWRILTNDKSRSALALIGIFMAILLVFVELGF